MVIGIKVFLTLKRCIFFEKRVNANSISGTVNVTYIVHKI